MRTVIHVGQLKTGSTWLQRHVFPTAKEAIFGCRDIHAPSDPVGRDYLNAVLLPDRRPSTEIAKRLRRKAALNGHDLLLSYEGLMGHPFKSFSSQRAQPHEIASRLMEDFGESKIIAVRRDPQALFVSLFKQYIQTGGTLTIDNYVETELDLGYFCFDEWIETWRSTFKTVSIIGYESAYSSPEAYPDALAAISGFKFDTISAARSNVSISKNRIRRLRLYNRFFRQSQFNPHPLLSLPSRTPYLIPGLMRNVRDIS